MRQRERAQELIAPHVAHPVHLRRVRGFPEIWRVATLDGDRAWFVHTGSGVVAPIAPTTPVITDSEDTVIPLGYRGVTG